MDSGMGTSKPSVSSSQETYIDENFTLSPSLLDKQKPANHKHQQTSLTTLADEDQQLAHLTVKQSNFLRDLLNAKSYSMVQRPKTKRTILQEIEVSKKPKNSNVSRKLCMDDYDQPPLKYVFFY